MTVARLLSCSVEERHVRLGNLATQQPSNLATATQEDPCKEH